MNVPNLVSPMIHPFPFKRKVVVLLKMKNERQEHREETMNKLYIYVCIEKKEKSGRKKFVCFLSSFNFPFSAFSLAITLLSLPSLHPFCSCVCVYLCVRHVESNDNDERFIKFFRNTTTQIKSPFPSQCNYITDDVCSLHWCHPQLITKSNLFYYASPLKIIQLQKFPK